jgi:hypothetical protein
MIEDEGQPDRLGINRVACNRLVIRLNDLEHDYPYIELEMRNGMEFNGFIVPLALESRLPDPRAPLRASPDFSVPMTPRPHDFDDLIALCSAAAETSETSETSSFDGTSETSSFNEKSTPTNDSESVTMSTSGEIYRYVGGDTAARLIKRLRDLPPDTLVTV